LREGGEARSLGQLAEATGLHPNTLRGHLDELVAAGAVRRTRAPAEGRGRPAWLYVADGPDAAPGNEYAGLAAALAIGLERTSQEPRRAAEEAGREWGRSLATQVGGDTDGAYRVRRVLERMGFAPQDGSSGSIRLTRCPLLQTARAHPEVVCGVHLGIVQGVLAESGSDDSGARLLPFAEPGACLLSLGGPAVEH
jgi:predicted ArsR family transcriptional regulator